MFQQPAEDRLRSWREFRLSLETLPLDQALTQTAEFWAKAPFTPYYLDPDSMENWPDPWTLIFENMYCDVAKCLGIVYTMLLTEHRKNLEVEIRTYIDPKNNYEYNLAYFNQGKYILNMIDGEIVNIKHVDNLLKLKKQFSAAQLQSEHY